MNFLHSSLHKISKIAEQAKIRPNTQIDRHIFPNIYLINSKLHWKNKSIYKLHWITIKTAAMGKLIGELVLWTKMSNRTAIF